MNPKKEEEEEEEEAEEEENGRRISSRGRDFKRRARTYSRKYIYTLQRRAEGGKRKRIWGIYKVGVRR